MARKVSARQSVLGKHGQQRIGAILRFARERQGLTLTQASSELFPGHESSDRLDMLETGQNFPSIKVLLDASALYDESAFNFCVEAGYVREFLAVLAKLRRLGDEVCRRFSLRLDPLAGLMHDGSNNDREILRIDTEPFLSNFTIAPIPVAASDPGQWAVPRATGAAIFIGVYTFRCRGEEFKAESVSWFNTRWREELVPFVDKALNFRGLAAAHVRLPNELEWAHRLLTANDLDPNARGFPACELVRHWLCGMSDKYVFYARSALFNEIPEVQYVRIKQQAQRETQSLDKRKSRSKPKKERRQHGNKHRPTA